MRTSALVLLLLATSCGDEAARPAQPKLGEAIQVVPSDGLPESIVVQEANNNLDVIRFGGRVYLAFRTGPFHFADPAVQMHLVSSVDQVTWEHEATFDFDSDLREPRFLAVGDRLFFYFAQLGVEMTDFEPAGAFVSEWESAGVWSAPEPVYLPGFIPWRTKVVGGTAYVIGYVGGENIYDVDGEGVAVHWLTTEDGRSFSPVTAEPEVLVGGGSETDFVFLPGGDLLAVVRNEAGDETGFGSKVCRAPAGDLAAWSCKSDKKKYDSPLLFAHGDDVWLIARRNLTESGNYDLGLDGQDPAAQYYSYQLDYWIRPKRCSLWQVDPDEQTVSFVLDLPSRGDTCFASILDDGGGDYTVYNYTSSLEGEEEPTWMEGQGEPTFIYRIPLSVP